MIPTDRLLAQLANVFEHNPPDLPAAEELLTDLRTRAVSDPAHVRMRDAAVVLCGAQEPGPLVYGLSTALRGLSLAWVSRLQILATPPPPSVEPLTLTAEEAEAAEAVAQSLNPTQWTYLCSVLDTYVYGVDATITGRGARSCFGALERKGLVTILDGADGGLGLTDEGLSVIAVRRADLGPLQQSQLDNALKSSKRVGHYQRQGGSTL